MARAVEGPTIAALARANRGDIDRAVDALAGARKQRVHVFLATSPIHRQHKLKMSREDVLRLATSSVEYARSRCEDVEFSAEDAARSEPEFLAEVVERVIEAGATTINIPDTVGYAVPAQFAELISFLRRTVRRIDDVALSVHCHDDLGLAVANSLAALQAGARQVECTVNGIGERAGNCSLEEVVMALRTRGRLPEAGDRDPHPAALPRQPAWSPRPPASRGTQQGGGGPERLRPRVRHPPARDDRVPAHLRGHAARGRGLQEHQPGPRQAQRAPRAGQRGCATSATSWSRRRSTRSSRS